uniref:Uncharacterized protein n=1 Tax=Avena sativa TaxID=4498 RepID=A0ACD6A151_AVESA
MANPRSVHDTILHKLSLVFLTCLVLKPNCHAISRDAEKAALLSLYRYWGKPIDINWGSVMYTDQCDWDGVICTAGFVTGISLGGCKLDRQIPSDICLFKNIWLIDLSHNNISGSFPTVLFNCSSLQHLDLSYNLLVGSLPSDIHLLSKNIAYLDLSHNSISSSFPTVLLNSSSLQYLDLSYNFFVGSIPSNIHLLSKMIVYLDLGSNNLSSSVPSSICQLHGLQFLYLDNNLFESHRIHPHFGNLINLQELSMSNMNIVGEIPDTISNLTQLRILNLSSNKLSQTIPSGVWRMKHLETLDLHNNSLSGGINRQTEAPNLFKIDLSTNILTGRIPDDFCKLKNLTFLYLYDNHLSGPIPENLKQDLFFLNLSSNKLTGQIPSPLQIKRFEQSFLSNPGLCSSHNFGNLPLCTRLHLKMIAIILLVLGSAILTFIGFIVLIKIKAILSKERDNAPSLRWKLTTFQAIDFNIQDILWSLIDTNLVGSGGSGKVYKIHLDNTNCEVIAVKKILSSLREHGVLEKQFRAEIEILGSIRHTNIIKLLGYISSSESKLLIYEYMEHGSLYEWLHQKDLTNTTRQLNWPTRMSIAIDAARGLSYMHHSCSPHIAHRDMKSSNILLDLEFKAKVADFGLARNLVKAGEPESVSAMVGTFGYMAPEFGTSRKINEKIDVYSFGVVLLELTTGRHPNGGGKYENLAQWAWRQFQDEGFQLTDVIDTDILNPAYLLEVQLVFKLGIICTGTIPSSRPSMREVLQVLQR